MMHVSHEILMAWEVVFPESDGTARHVGIRLDELGGKGVHHVGAVQVGHHIKVEVTCGLFYTQQDVVNTLHNTFQRL